MGELDEEIIRDLMDSFHELYEQVDSDLSQLISDPNKERLNSIFRGIHTIKGHAAMFHLPALVNFSHALEDVAESLRSHKIFPSKLLCEALHLGMDRLRDLHYRDLLQQNFPNLEEETIQQLYSDLSKKNNTDVDKSALKIIEFMDGGLDPELINSPPESSNTDEEQFISPAISPKSNEKRMLDLSFFQELSFQVDRANPYWIDRSIQQFDLSQKVNKLAGSPIDYQQLAAATYIHDFGMAILNQDILHKKGSLTEEETNEMRRHVAWGYDFLIRIPGWEEAAVIVLNHHERVDGGGYPNALKGKLIHPGAKILAIVDAFFSIINGRADRNQRRSIIRAMSEINAAAGSQFDSEWVSVFNEVIKIEAKSGLL